MARIEPLWIWLLAYAARWISFSAKAVRSSFDNVTTLARLVAAA
jgi:hypothetical protein